MRIALCRSVLACLVCVVAAASLQAAVIPGPEFQVNAYSTSGQRYPDVALDTDFDFVVVWQSLGQDGSNEGVFARRYDSSGATLGGNFQVNSYTSISQLSPVVAMAGNGDFVVAWTSYNQDGSNAGIFAQRFNSSGAPQATEFQVNTYTLGSQGGAFTPPGNAGPAIAAETNGDFVVAWTDFSQAGVGANGGIFARRFNSAGTGLAIEFHVNSYTSSAQSYPSLDVDADGDFVVTWQSYGQDGSQLGVFARRFASSGNAIGVDFQVNSRTSLSQHYPDVSLENNGEFVVVWQSFSQDGENLGIFGRRFSANGAGLAVEFQVNVYTTGNQEYPSIGVDGDGDFLVTWQSSGLDGDNDGIFARRWNTLGQPVGGEFMINDLTANAQNYPAVGINGVGDFVVAWQKATAYGFAQEIGAKRFDNVSVLDIDASGAITPLTDGLLVLRFLFNFTGSSLIGGVVDMANCQRCDAPAIEAYLATLM